MVSCTQSPAVFDVADLSTLEQQVELHLVAGQAGLSTLKVPRGSCWGSPVHFSPVAASLHPRTCRGVPQPHPVH